MFFPFFLLLFCAFLSAEPVTVGIELLDLARLKGKKISLLTNSSAVNSLGHSTLEFLTTHPQRSWELISYCSTDKALATPCVPPLTLFKNVDLVLFDLQDTGVRHGNGLPWLFFTLQQAGKQHIPVILLDRPNPINGLICEGPLIDPALTEALSTPSVPYCHGMTLGELAHYLNQTYQLGCCLEVIAMEGWQRSMSYEETGLPWIPLDPLLPHAHSPLYYPMTALLSELEFVSIGCDYTLPFQVIGAPWVEATAFVNELNKAHLPGVFFVPFHYSPLCGKYAGRCTQGALILIKNPQRYRPLMVQFFLFHLLKKMYPKEFQEALNLCGGKKEHFNAQVGSPKAWNILLSPRPLQLEMGALHEASLRVFRQQRTQFLLPCYHKLSTQNH